MKNLYFLILSFLVVINVFAQKAKTKTTVKKTTPKTTTTNKSASSSTAPKTTTTTTTKKTTPKKATYTTTKADTATMNLIGAEICTCLAPITDSLHPALLEMFDDMVTIGAAKAQEKLQAKVAAMDEEEKKKFESSSAIMDKMASENSPTDACTKNIEKKYPNFKMENKTEKDKAMQKLLIYVLEQQCKNVAKVIKLATVTEE